MTEVQAMT